MTGKQHNCSFMAHAFMRENNMTDLFKPMTLEDKYFLDQITHRINNPMKLFRMTFYQKNKDTEVHELKFRVLDAKGLAEFIIMNAYNQDVMVKEVKEL